MFGVSGIVATPVEAVEHGKEGGPQLVDGGGLLTTTLTDATAFLVGSAALVAATVADIDVLTLGAVKTPLLEIVPALADQITPFLLVPLTVAVNCCVPPETTVAVAGETATSRFGRTTTLALA
jgi:hypothetical protein